MSNRIVRRGGLTALAVAIVALVAWRAPEPRAAAAVATPTVNASAPATAAPIASYAPVVDRVIPAVVTVRVEKRASMIPTADQQFPDDDLFRRFFGERGPQMRIPRQPRGIERGLGSGVIVTQDGYILTNDHVVDGADEVKVELPDRRTFTAKVIGTDAPSDLAVIKISASDLPTLPLGDSDAARVGDVVLAIGNPLGIGETVTSGIISAKGRQTPDGRDGYQDFIQTDAPINHGNSGGALVNTNGQLIGINSQILSPSDGNIGLGFAIPANMAKSVMDQLIKHGAVHRAKLGVTIQGITPDLAQSLGLASTKGALVSNVETGSPAARAGLRQGDVITEFNGKPVTDNNQLRNNVASTAPGSTVTLKYLRDGRTETANVTLGELALKKDRATGDHERRGEGRFGMSVQPFTPDMADQLGVPSSTEGLVVAGVDPDGRAAEAGIQEGDVIEKVNGHAVKTGDELKAALDRTTTKPALLLVNRKGSTFFATLRAE
jgi:serine protease Do